MEYNENSLYAKLAKEYLAQKERQVYYTVTLCNEERPDEYCTLEKFTDEELEALHKLRDKYGKDQFVMHLDEIGIDDFIDFACGDEVLDIDLDYKSYRYEFGRHELRDDKLVRYTVLVELRDEEYIRLLALCLEDQTMNINKLKYVYKNGYDWIMHYVDATLSDDGFFCGSYPYLVTMDELFADVEQILTDHPELRRKGSGYTGYFFA